MAKGRDDDRARKTLYVTGFNSKLTTKSMLHELFLQGGPVVDVTMFDTHAYILFKDEESVAYCLALFNEVELHGEKLRINPKFRTKNTYCYLNYLAKVRQSLRDANQKIEPPNLPAKVYPKTSGKVAESSKKSLRGNSSKFQGKKNKRHNVKKTPKNSFRRLKKPT